MSNPTARCLSQGYHPMSPSTDMLPALPPMSSFRGGGVAPPPPPPPQSAYSSPPPPTTNGADLPPTSTRVPSSGSGTQQTGDALGKALASVSTVRFFRYFLKY